MESATILTPPKTGLSGVFCFPSERPEYEKISSQYQCLCFESNWKMVWILTRWIRKEPADLGLQCFLKCKMRLQQ